MTLICPNRSQPSIVAGLCQDMRSDGQPASFNSKCWNCKTELSPSHAAKWTPPDDIEKGDAR